MQPLSLRPTACPPRHALPTRRALVIVAGEGRSANRAKWSGAGGATAVVTPVAADPPASTAPPPPPAAGSLETPEQLV